MTAAFKPTHSASIDTTKERKLPGHAGSLPPSGCRIVILNPPNRALEDELPAAFARCSVVLLCGGVAFWADGHEFRSPQLLSTGASKHPISDREANQREYWKAAPKATSSNSALCHHAKPATSNPPAREDCGDAEPGGASEYQALCSSFACCGKVPFCYLLGCTLNPHRESHSFFYSPFEKCFRNNSRQRFSPSSVIRTDLALPTGSRISPALCRR